MSLGYFIPSRTFTSANKPIRGECCKFQMQTSLSPSVCRAFLGCQVEKVVDELNLSKKIISCHPSSLPLPDHVDPHFLFEVGLISPYDRTNASIHAALREKRTLRRLALSG